MNWKLRLKNKPTLVALIAAAVAFAYQVLGIFGVVPGISQDALIQMLGIVVNLLVGLGVVVDPTTQGIGDSRTALAYDEPKTAALDSFQAVVRANQDAIVRKDDGDEPVDGIGEDGQ